MRRYAVALYIGIFTLLSPALSFAENYNGQWLGTITESVNNCKNLGKAEPGEYKLTIIHQDNDITIMENVVQRPYEGVINPAKTQSVQVHGTYTDDGGYVSELVTINFTDEATGEAHSVWQWSDGYYFCGGQFKFTLTKIRD